MTSIGNIFGVIATGVLLLGVPTMVDDVSDFGFSGTFGEVNISKFPHWFNQSTTFDNLVERDNGGHWIQLSSGSKTGRFVSSRLTLRDRPYRLKNISYEVFYPEPDSEIVLSVNRTDFQVDPSFTLENGTNFIDFDHSLNGEDLKLELDFRRTSSSDGSPRIYRMDVVGDVNRGSDVSKTTQNAIVLFIIGFVVASIVFILGG